MASKHFAKAIPRSTMTVHVTLAIKEGQAAETPRPVPPGTSTEYIDLLAAYLGVANGIAELLALENAGGKRSLLKLFKNSKPRETESGFLVQVSLPQRRHGRNIPFNIERTWQLLSTRCTAEALSRVHRDAPEKSALLCINEAIHSHGVEIRIECNESSIELRDLGLADRTHPGEDWQDEILLVLTGVDYRLRALTAETPLKQKVQFLLRLDTVSYEKLQALGPAHVRLWGRGFSTKKFLRIIEVYEYELLAGETFHQNVLSYQDR